MDARAAHRAAGDPPRAGAEAYYAFHAEVSGFPLEVVKVSHPLSQFPEAAYPAEGLALLDEVKKFLLAENLVSRDFALAQWRAPEA
jgi:sulfonate transport system substrate-binding protein